MKRNKVKINNKKQVARNTNVLIAQHQAIDDLHLQECLSDLSYIECECCQHETAISICLKLATTRHELLQSYFVDLSEAERNTLYEERLMFIKIALDSTLKLSDAVVTC
jgi:hypothetical protein